MPRKVRAPDDAQRARPHRAAEQVRGDRRPDRDEHAAADRLDEPRGDELVHRLGRSGQRGPDDEHDERAQEQPARAPQVGEAAGHRHRQDVDQQVAVDDPAGLAQLDPGRSQGRVGEVGQDRRQRDGRDHELEAGQEHARPDHGEQHVRRTAVHPRECSGRGRCRRSGASGIGRFRRSPPQTGLDSAPSRLGRVPHESIWCFVSCARGRSSVWPCRRVRSNAPSRSSPR